MKIFTKENLKNKLIIFINSILAGISISIGGVAFLSCNSAWLGALFFCVGLFIILTFNFNLFTGKVCYALDNKVTYIFNLIIIWLGNLIGTMVSALFVSLTRLSSVQEKCVQIVNTKLNDSMLSVFVLAIFCNILIYIAVDGFKNNNHEIGKYLSLIFGVSVFVLCGFEHCVADMFYFYLAGVFNLKSVIYILIITCGNIVGGLLLPLCKKLCEKLSSKESK